MKGRRNPVFEHLEFDDHEFARVEARLEIDEDVYLRCASISWNSNHKSTGNEEEEEEDHFEDEPQLKARQQKDNDPPYHASDQDDSDKDEEEEEETIIAREEKKEKEVADDDDDDDDDDETLDESNSSALNEIDDVLDDDVELSANKARALSLAFQSHANKRRESGGNIDEFREGYARSKRREDLQRDEQHDGLRSVARKLFSAAAIDDDGLPKESESNDDLTSALASASLSVLHSEAMIQSARLSAPNTATGSQVFGWAGKTKLASANAASSSSKSSSVAAGKHVASAAATRRTRRSAAAAEAAAIAAGASGQFDKGASESRLFKQLALSAKLKVTRSMVQAREKRRQQRAQRSPASNVASHRPSENEHEKENAHGNRQHQGVAADEREKQIAVPADEREKDVQIEVPADEQQTTLTEFEDLYADECPFDAGQYQVMFNVVPRDEGEEACDDALADVEVRFRHVMHVDDEFDDLVDAAHDDDDGDDGGSSPRFVFDDDDDDDDDDDEESHEDENVYYAGQDSAEDSDNESRHFSPLVSRILSGGKRRSSSDDSDTAASPFSFVHNALKSLDQSAMSRRRSLSTVEANMSRIRQQALRSPTSATLERNSDPKQIGSASGNEFVIDDHGYDEQRQGDERDDGNQERQIEPSKALDVERAQRKRESRLSMLSSPSKAAIESDAVRLARKQRQEREEDELAARGGDVSTEQQQLAMAASDSYFEMATSRSRTSDNTMEDVQLLAASERRKMLERLRPNHERERAELESFVVRTCFPRWKRLLRSGFNVLCFGIGSKKALLEKFARELREHGDGAANRIRPAVMLVNGYFPGMSIKLILNAITRDWMRCTDRSFATAIEQCRFVETRAASGALPRGALYLIVHNVETLRSHSAQTVLSLLGAIDQIRLVGSIDQLNAPLLWDNAMSARFNWVWVSTPTFARYNHETCYEMPVLGTGDKVGHVNSQVVLDALTPNARSCFRILAQHQAANPSTRGLSFDRLLDMCRQDMCVTDQHALKAHLNEFKDHTIVKVRHGRDGIEYLYIPASRSTIQSILSSLAADN
jgi:origin recognition complex subunit 2